jgi:hypothetical protein
VLSQQGFRHLAASRVVGAQEEDLGSFRLSWSRIMIPPRLIASSCSSRRC